MFLSTTDTIMESKKWPEKPWDIVTIRGLFYGSQCTQSAIVRVPFLESVVNNKPRSLNDLATTHWVRAGYHCGPIFNSMLGHRTIIIDDDDDKIDLMADALTFFFIAGKAKRAWHRNELLYKLYPERTVHGDILIIKHNVRWNVLSDISSTDIPLVENILCQ
ncbi:hypothetical protein EV421DRAFT_1913617 [Armillaria borealis]|uniref:Uncharacterized protein n=1 Tax=Armillaria borealis TaxID=47425 RepID=A0AA39IT10_9AGAR|nr:hypothetical protein EV421DRAFT_1913617 [Armillaria borealis]